MTTKQKCFLKSSTNRGLLVLTAATIRGGSRGYLAITASGHYVRSQTLRLLLLLLLLFAVVVHRQSFVTMTHTEQRRQLCCCSALSRSKRRERGSPTSHHQAYSQKNKNSLLAARTLGDHLSITLAQQSVAGSRQGG